MARSLSAYRSRVAFCILTLLLRCASASNARPRGLDTVHRLAKAQVTAAPRLGKRDDASICPTGNSLCPASLNGGCCPDRYACATDSCYATTAAYTTACGKPGYFACGADVGGGCCPQGFVCGANDCSPPPGVTNTFTHCPTGSFLCPSSLNYGCCKNGLACGLSACYSTAPTTYTITQAVTTTSAGSVFTVVATDTTVETPTIPTNQPASDSSAVAKFIPSQVAKVSASAPTDSSNNNSSGLPSATLGGIIAGCLIFLIIVLLAAFFVWRRTRTLERQITAAPKHGSSSSSDNRATSSQPKRRSGFGIGILGHPFIKHPTASEVDAMSYDPLMANSSGPGSPTPPSQMAERQRYLDGGRSGSNSNFSTPQPYTPYSGPVEALATEGSDGITARHFSVDSSGGAGYFDVPPRVQNRPGRHSNSTGVARSSVDSAGTPIPVGGQVFSPPLGSPPAPGQVPAQIRHGRSWSNNSDFSSPGSSEGSEGRGSASSPLVPAELDVTGGFYPELPTSPGIVAKPPFWSLKWAGEGASVFGRSGTGPGGKGAGGAGGVGSSGGKTGERSTRPKMHERMPSMDAVSEAPTATTGSVVQSMHGFYGPRDRQVGQTAVGLDGTGTWKGKSMKRFEFGKGKEKEGKNEKGGVSSSKDGKDG